VKTIVILTIEHKKPLPVKVPITDIAADRIQNYLYSQGCEASVTATQLSEIPRKLQMWEQGDGQPS
jgi:hypothetical protein